ncbi:MAG: substrate-binding periplasmic protein [Bacteroidota bacterium]
MRLAWLLAFLPLVVAGSTRADPVIRVCTTEWPPYTVGSGAAVRGLHTELVIEAFRRLGLEVRIDVVAWERCWKELSKDTYQAVYSASFNDSRARLALYPRTPLQRLSYVAVVRRGAGAGSDGHDLGTLPQPLAAPRGYSITENLRRRGHQVDDGAMKDSQNIEKLLSGRIGTAVVEKQVATALIAGLGAADKVEVLPAVIEAKDYFLVVGRTAGGSEAAARTLTERLDRVLAELQRECFADRLPPAEAPR